ncbi:hypothetical protein [Paraburkholderia caballeronis]|uniref:hypothetical protein n=1 Tax=Paraburkholderia caballeronis TaxID=416943 RepID=UPI0010657062|nr:hypothetical protein [Paraburkholderia caballeronis]TDV15606.1 hypothetical protein C7408_10663 [Paraburkholderia caballeronis]TDV17861.1 hypothetical protein C7406_10563 [Paraburkholderia caballeronis]TDV26525.1 hypothetical protein C7404_106228 [Paraburkholderia caballeronis]
MKRIVLAALVVATGIASFAAHAQGVLAPGGAPAAPVNPLTRAASSVGVRQCLPALDALSSIGVRGATRSDVLIDWDRAHPNGAPVFSLVGLETAQGNAVMSVNAAPAADGTCAVSAERVAFDPSPCRQVAQRELRDYRATPLLPHMTVYTRDREPGSTVSLVDSPPGCLTIRRYVKFSASYGAGPQ